MKQFACNSCKASYCTLYNVAFPANVSIYKIAQAPLLLDGQVILKYEKIYRDKYKSICNHNTLSKSIKYLQFWDLNYMPALEYQVIGFPF